MNKIFEVRDRNGELYFERFLIRETEDYELLYHKIYKADKDPHLHNHSWWFRTTIVKGGYVERRINNVSGTELKRTWLAGDSYEMWKGEYHKIHRTMFDFPTETIVLRTKTDEDTWGYLVDGKHVPHVEYRKLINDRQE
tara:strand:+ start:247 stop:663 length:417 start_codon:yes stop_codon:yes gene_type:complete